MLAILAERDLCFRGNVVLLCPSLIVDRIDKDNNYEYDFVAVDTFILMKGMMQSM